MKKRRLLIGKILVMIGYLFAICRFVPIINSMLLQFGYVGILRTIANIFAILAIAILNIALSLIVVMILFEVGGFGNEEG